MLEAIGDRCRAPGVPGDVLIDRWRAHFRQNGKSWAEFDWSEVDRLSPGERRIVARSIAAFQRGETGDGSNLVHWAAAKGGSPSHPFADLMGMFVQEEQRHARVLRRAMQVNGIARAERQWTDAIFRALRHGLGMLPALAILLAVEILACLYYDALARATGSPLLRRVASRICQDEADHVLFQCDLLGSFTCGWARWLRRAGAIGLTVAFAAAASIVWFEHRQVLRRGGYRLRSFFLTAGASLHQALSTVERRASAA